MCAGVCFLTLWMLTWPCDLLGPMECYVLDVSKDHKCAPKVWFISYKCDSPWEEQVLYSV